MDIPEESNMSFYGGKVSVGVKDAVFETSSALRNAFEDAMAVKKLDRLVILSRFAVRMAAQSTGPGMAQTKLQLYAFFVNWSVTFLPLLIPAQLRVLQPW